MSRYAETQYALAAAGKEWETKKDPYFTIEQSTVSEEALKQIAISLSQIVDILRKEAKKSSKE